MLEQPLQQPTLSVSSATRAWVVSMTAALFFFYEFVQLNMFGAVHDELIHHLHLAASEYGLLSAIYLFANVIFLIPAGYLLDKYSTKRIILIALALCILGTYMFSVVDNFAWASVARFLTGIGSAFCFVGCIHLASRWFPQEQMALVTGCIITIAMLGGFMAQTPLSYLIRDVGWQRALYWDALGGIVIFTLIAFIVQDQPDGFEKIEEDNHNKVCRKAMLSTYLKWNNWKAALFTSFMNMPMVVLGAVWGIPYLNRVHHFSTESASMITSMLFFGIIIGSPITGWVSDTLQIRKPIMIMGAVATLVMSFVIMWIPTDSFAVFVSLFFLLGFILSAQVLSYPLVTATNPSYLTATAVSIISFVTQGGGALYQILYGYLLDHMGATMHLHGMVRYASTSYAYAFIMMPIGAFLAVLLAVSIKEA